ncbi:hypothetical protein MBLNU230_g4905t1 [Neophaeotheca triangularis]
MAKLILAINAGSSSVKVSVYSYQDTSSNPTELATIQIAGLTAPPATLKYDRGDEHIKDKELPNIKSQDDAFSHLLNHLTSDPNLTALTQPSDIEFACHRIVHGGSYAEPTRIDSDTYHHLEALSDLAPLHNTPALQIVKTVHNLIPTATNIAFFDSAFHATLPAPTRTYAIDPSTASKNLLRRYGFHGISYAYITRTLAAHLSKPAPNLIALHLGSGCSAACIQSGKSIDTTMGLTPLSGLPGATRSGDVDPSLIFHFTHDAGRPSPGASKELHITQAEMILNKQSGWKAMTGTTDFGAISAKAGQGDEACGLAFELVVERLVKEVGAYFVKLGGRVDGLVFAGGIGEKGVELRRRAVEGVGCLGFELDGGRNEGAGEGKVREIGREGARFRTFVVETDEQAEMARQCVGDVDRLRRPA